MIEAAPEGDQRAPLAFRLTYVRLDAPNELTLLGAFTVANVAAIHAELSSVLDVTPSAVVIDMSGVTELDTAGLQLLLALRLSMSSRVHSCPATLRDFIERMGLMQILT